MGRRLGGVGCISSRIGDGEIVLGEFFIQSCLELREASRGKVPEIRCRTLTYDSRQTPQRLIMYLATTLLTALRLSLQYWRRLPGVAEGNGWTASGFR